MHKELSREQQNFIDDLIKLDSVLPDTVQYVGGESPRTDLRHIMLTGVTGVVGPYVLCELLAQTQATVHVLVRKHEGVGCEQYLMKHLAKHHLSNAVDSKRIKVIEGNVAKPNLGLSAANYKKLAKTIDMVFHNAAWTNHVRPYASPHSEEKSDLRETNTLSLREVLLFASTKKTKYVNFTSTFAAVNRCDFSGNLVEELPSVHNPGDHIYIGYPQSKFVAEKLIQQANTKGLMSRVFRLGQVTGNSKTGMQFADNDHMILEIKGCLQLGYAPDWKFSRNFSAVDISARIMVYLALKEGIDNDAYNIVTPAPIAWLDIIKCLNKRGHSVKIIEEKQWSEKISQIDPSNVLFPFKDGYTKAGGIGAIMPAMEKAFYGKINYQKTLRALAGVYIEYPSSEQLFEKYLDYFETTGFMPPAK